MYNERWCKTISPLLECDCRIVFITSFFFKQKTAYEMRISDWSSDVCSSDLGDVAPHRQRIEQRAALKQHAEPAAHPLKLAPAHAGHVLAVHQYAAFIHLHQAQDPLQHPRLAGSGPADPDTQFARLDAAVASIQPGLAPKPLERNRILKDP